MSRYERIYLLLAALFVASLLVANMLVFKFFDVTLPLIGTITLSAGILPYPVTFLMTDLISELYGKKRADTVVVAGFLVSLYMMVLIQLGRILPVSHLQTDVIQEHYMAVFGTSVRAIMGSMIAYLAAQLIDVRLYHFWKQKTAGRHLWLRNNGSTMFSQLIDTVAVVSILFAGVQPVSVIVTVIASSYVFKLMTAALDTPLMYAGAALFADIERETAARLAETGEA